MRLESKHDLSHVERTSIRDADWTVFILFNTKLSEQQLNNELIIIIFDSKVNVLRN